MAGKSRLVSCNYFGGKARHGLNVWLNSLIPYDRRGLYCEPFAGMLGLLLSRRRVKVEVVNDLDGHIYTFWRVVRDHAEEFKHLVDHTPHCRQTFRDAWRMLESGDYEDDLVKKAWAVFVVVHHSVGHGLGKTGWAVKLDVIGGNRRIGMNFGQWVPALSERLRNVQLENCDALDILCRTAYQKRAVIYCDPPYLSGSTEVYGLDKVDRSRMSQLLQSQKGRVEISGYGDEWDHLGWEKHEYDIHFVGLGSGGSSRRVECLWVNYDVEVQGTLF